MVRRIDNVCGVYLGRNLVTGHVYVGSSIKCKARIESHTYSLRKGRHSNRYLQAAWDKYGEEAFVWEILEICEPKERFKCEQKWVVKLKAYESSFGYNLLFPVQEKGGALISRTSIKHREYWSSLKGAKRAKRINHLLEKNPAIISHTMKALWQDPEFRAKRLAGLTVGRNKTNATVTAACKYILSEGRAIAIARNKTPEYRAKQRANALKQYQEPAMKALRLKTLQQGRVTQHRAALARKGLLGHCDCHLCVGQ